MTATRVRLVRNHERGAGASFASLDRTYDPAAGVRHGYVFEVPADGASDAVPLKAMGRFSHEATATEPATGIVYLTGDAGSSAFYRFRPVSPRNLAAGGVLEASRGEGAWYGNGGVYVVSTNGGPAGQGQVLQLVVRQHPEPRYHLRHHGAMEEGCSVGISGSRGLGGR